MLRTWQIANFKSIREMNEPLDFAPLTIFCGANSSGKSSLLQSMLLFKQTLQKKNIPGLRMALNGKLVKLGNLNDITTDGSGNEISCDFQIDNYGKLLEDENVLLHFFAGNAKPQSSTQCAIRFGTYEYEIEEKKSRLFMQYKEIKKSTALYPIVKSVEINGILIPSGTGGRLVSLAHVYEETSLAPGYVHFFPNPFGDLVIGHDVTKDAAYQTGKQDIYDFFCENLYYIGPLRVDPKESDDITSQQEGVGHRGEYTAECVALYTSKNERYLSPLSNIKYKALNADDKMTRALQDIETFDLFRGGAYPVPYHPSLDDSETEVMVTLREALSAWLTYLEIADEAYVTERGELIVKQGKGKEKRLNNVGVGVSQILPIVVQCVIAEPGSTIIIEQPELHLHPKTQSRLADFFLVMSLLGKQIIIETHSEYIIDKLRLRIVQAPVAAPINDKIALYFAEKKKGYSEFRRIHINEFSVMDDWPEGFFEESMKIARDILFAARQKEQEDDDD